MSFPASIVTAVRHEGDAVARIMFCGEQIWPLAAPPLSTDRIDTTGALGRGGHASLIFQIPQRTVPVEPLPADLYVITPTGQRIDNPTVSEDFNAKAWYVQFPPLPAAPLGTYTLFQGDDDVASATFTPYVKPPDLLPWSDPDGNATLADDAGKARLTYPDYVELIIDEQHTDAYARGTDDEFTFSVTLRDVTAPMVLSYLLLEYYSYPFDAQYNDKVTVIDVDPGERTYTFEMTTADWTAVVADFGRTTGWQPYLTSETAAAFTLVDWSITPR